MSARRGRAPASSITARLVRIAALAGPLLAAPGAAFAETAGDVAASATGLQIEGLAGASLVLVLMGFVTGVILTSRRLEGSSLFNRLFIVVAVTAGFFSAVSSAIGFSLITGQETEDFFRNSILPPAFGVFVFFLAVAIWVGGAGLVRHRDWFRSIRRGFISDMLFFLERCLKIFVVIPVLATILFFVSTWTTVVGVGGVDAVRHTYDFEIARLQAECAGITAYRQRDFLFLEDLRQSARDVARVAASERIGGAQSGAAGNGAVTAYFTDVARWLAELEASVAAIIEGPDPSGVAPYDPDICSTAIETLKRRLAANAFDNYDAWARDFETGFNDFSETLNRWRHDRRIEIFLDQQAANFDRANPKPTTGGRSQLSAGQRAAIDRYAEDVRSALETLVRRQKLAKPPVPQKSAAELSPERGLEIFRTWFRPHAPNEAVEDERVSRTASVVAEELVPGLSTLTPRDAVLKNANIFSDVWALAIAWDYAPYVLMLAFLFFPSAERAPGHKD